jgi:subtilisin family serine protease
MKKYLPLLLLAVALLAAMPGRAAGPTGSEADSTAWPVVAAPGVLDITQGRDADRPPHPRLDDALAELAAQPAGERAADAPTTDGLTMQDGRVQARLVVAADGQDAARAAVVAAGGEVTGALDGALQVWLPPATLTAVADSPGVAYLGAPDYAQLAAADAVSEGVARAEATAWHVAGLRGQGVRIAIIDGGFQGYTAKLGSELPANVVVKNFVDGQPDAEVDATTPHGTACAEIVYDMAPSAQLYLIKIATDVDLDQAVSYAIAQNVDVISTSLTFLNITPGDGTGRFAAMADRARAAGILWTTAAGNYRETHWSGTSTDGDNDNLHEYAPGVEVNVFGPGNGSAYQIPAGVVLSPALRWDDWTEVRQDFRLLLLRYNGATFDIVASANNPQTGLPGQRPTERLNYITTGGAAIYGVAIQRISGARPVFLNLLTPNRELDRRVTAMSLGDLADVPGVLTVGAVTINMPFPAADYSSEGPTTGPGGTADGGQRKPDIAAFAGVSTASYGTRAFSGTSAATPHVAGAAALISNRHPTFGPDAIRFHLEEMAVDQGPACADTRYGFGRLLLQLPRQPAGDRLFLPFVNRSEQRC